MKDTRRRPVPLAPDPVVDAYKPGIDVSLLDENLKLTPGERVRKLQAFVESLERLGGAAGEKHERALRDDPPGPR